MRFWLAAPAALCVALAAPVRAQDADPHAGHQSAEQPAAHDQHDMGEMGDMHEGHGDHSGHMEMPEGMSMDHMHEGMEMSHDMAMTGVLGAYPMSRDASGTSWQPDASVHGGIHAMSGAWTTMSHLMLNGVYDWQDSPRGDEKTFVSGMAMMSARRDVGHGDTLHLRAMLSPDPFMGAGGYPLLLAGGETANGETPLIDRQHPHDLIMELSASYAHNLGDGAGALYAYVGLPGEPAFGPPAFMHRLSAMDSPEAPITHHWLDSTHITFGVATFGYVRDDWKIEVSRFRGREPDENRYDIETGDLDSSSARVSWNPNANLALQASWADIKSPEQLEPDEDQTRYSASAIYTRALGDDAWVSSTLAFGRKIDNEHRALDAWLAEAALHPNEDWTLFARAERIETNELTSDHDDPARTVARVSLGAIRDWRIAEHAVVGLGALAQTHRVPDALEADYGGDPAGAMAFVRLKIG